MAYITTNTFFEVLFINKLIELSSILILFATLSKFYSKVFDERFLFSE